MLPVYTLDYCYLLQIHRPSLRAPWQSHDISSARQRRIGPLRPTALRRALASYSLTTLYYVRSSRES
jgi:hypothetical protein